MTNPDALKAIDDFPSLVAYLRDELEWEIPEHLPLDKLTYSYTADELGLKLDAQVEITQLRPILGQQNPWGVFFVDFDKAELPVTLLRRILSSVSRRKRESANPGDRALFDKNDLLFVSAFGKADDRRLALAHFHQEPNSAALPTLRVLTWDRQDTPRHMATVTERLERLRWPDGRQLEEAWKARWAGAFVDRPRDGIRTAKEMAQELAHCAKQIRLSIQEILPKEKPGQPLTQLFEAVKSTLNKDLDVPKFADTYAQTIAYGLLSKRIDQVQRWRAEKAATLNSALPLPSITTDALETAIPTNPFLSELLSSFMAAVGRNAGGSALDFDELGLGDLVDLLNTANMEAVLDDFDKDKQGDDPVIHFYEGFLAAYDKAMKVQRGVFYTPKPVVSFIVRSVDEVLRTEFGLSLGLADTTTWGEFVAAHPKTKIPNGARADDPFVKILDPATGTGTFLVEVIDLIHSRMMDAWKDKPKTERARLWNHYVPRHLLPRLYGYELMMAPYAVAHMKIGLKLADTGYDFSGAEMGSDGKSRPTRARVFLTNALEPAQDLGMQLAFMNEALAHEARAANDAKARTRFTVVVGNPPYSLESGNLSDTHKSRIERYRFVDGERIRERAALQFEKVLNDDYVKFWALSEDQVRSTGQGVTGLITSHAFGDSLFLRGMRQSLITTFPAFVLIDLHGNSAKNEQSPDGHPDSNVFDIQQGVAVSIAWTLSKEASVRRADFWGSRERKYLDLSRQSLRGSALEDLSPKSPKYLFVRPRSDGSEAYDAYPAVDAIFGQYGAGYITARDNLVLDLDREKLVARVEGFANSNLSDSDLLKAHDVADKKGWNVQRARAALRGLDVSENVIRATYRPFDLRYIFYHDSLVWGRSWPTMKHLLGVPNPIALVTTKVTKDRWDIGCTAAPTAHKAVSAYDTSSVFPLFLEPVAREKQPRPNLSPAFTARLANLTGLRFDDGSDAPAQEALPGTEPPQPAHRALSLRRERGDLKTTFGARDVFDWIYGVLHSPTYRERFADFLKSDFARVPLPKDRGLFAALIPLGGRLVALHLLDADGLPDLLADPRVRFVSNGGEPRLGRFNKEVRRAPSGRVYLNDQSWFATVPQTAWDHWIGGYQPARKWLKDRSETGSKDKLKPGRLLTDEDILHYRRMIVALEETGKVMAEIDEVIASHGGWPDAFRGLQG